MITIIIITLIILLLQLIAGDNPSAIIKPYDGPDPGYIVAESDGGLSNRLRVLAAYMWVAYSKYNGAHLVFIWDVNEACPGHFLQIFEPIPSVIFATNSSRYVLDKNAKVVYENSLAVFTWTLMMNDIPKSRYGMPSWSDMEYRMYSRYVPIRDVMDKASIYIKQYNICNSSAMHIRLTDLSIHLNKKKKHVNIQSYMDYVDNSPKHESIYLLTDNPTTQKLFLDKYGRQKILVYNEILSADKQKPMILRNDPNKIINGQGSVNINDNVNTVITSANNIHTSSIKYGINKNRKHHNLTDDHRYTSTEHTLIDVIIAAHAKNFKPAMFSSLSDLVNMYQKIGRKEWGWCQ